VKSFFVPLPNLETGWDIPNSNDNTLVELAKIPNLGYNVFIKAEENIKIAAYHMHASRSGSVNSIISDMTLDSTQNQNKFKMAKEDHIHPTEKLTIKEKNWTRTLDDIEEFLCNHLGQAVEISKIPADFGRIA
jgi:hypothetical protein